MAGLQINPAISCLALLLRLSLVGGGLHWLWRWRSSYFNGRLTSQTVLQMLRLLLQVRGFILLPTILYYGLWLVRF